MASEAKSKKHSFVYRNGLIIVFSILTIISLCGQFITGKKEYDEFLNDHKKPGATYTEYFISGHFIESVFENWESEFFQMGCFVVFTIFLRQVGSSESKEIGKFEECDKEPVSHPKAPWPVKKGGWILSVYKHSLSIALFFLFVISFYLHFYGSYKDYKLTQTLENKTVESATDYLSSSRFWFESFQNWQSEFLSVMVLIFLSIYLRQIGSPQSKAVDSSHDENE